MSCQCSKVCRGEAPDGPVLGSTVVGGKQCWVCGKTIMYSEQCTRGMVQWVTAEDAAAFRLAGIGIEEMLLAHGDCAKLETPEELKPSSLSTEPVP